MSTSVVASLVLAASSAAALNWGFFAQHQAVSGAIPRLSVRHPLTSLRALFSNLRWLTGFTVGLAGWGLYIAALRLGPLSLVQAVSAGGVGLLALFVSQISHVRLSRTEWNGVGLSIAGLLLLGISLIGTSSGDHHAHWTIVALWAGGSAAIAGFFVGPGARSLAAGAGYGVAAGTLYAAGDVATKAAVTGGVAIAFTAAVLACHGGAFVALQLGFQRGGAIATVGVSTVFTNALPIAAGMLVFRERLPSGALGAVRLLAFVAVVAGAALLTYAGDSRETAPTPQAARQH
jgi:hypothetical protein